MPESTPTAADLARQISETARALNYATLPHAGFPGLEWPSDAYDTVGALAEAARRLEQTAGHLCAFVRSQASRPGLYHDRGADPRRVVGDALGDLSRAAVQLGGAAAELGRAHQTTAGLGVADTTEGGAR